MGDAQRTCWTPVATIRLGPLLDISSTHHGLLLPILLHCVDEQGRPVLGPSRKGRETEEFLRNAPADIPDVVEAMDGLG